MASIKEEEQLAGRNHLACLYIVWKHQARWAAQALPVQASADPLPSRFEGDQSWRRCSSHEGTPRS